MPVDTGKEVVKVAVEASGSLAEWWRWVIGGCGAGVVALWGHITGRVKVLEDTAITGKALKEHIDYENEKFRVLFEQSTGNAEILTQVRESVARIEGRLEK